jgi:hypothetical protein
MANRSRPTLLKREREKARLEKQKTKQARRSDKARQSTPRSTDGVDPDIAHITPGPQPPAPWQVDEE